MFEISNCFVFSLKIETLVKLPFSDVTLDNTGVCSVALKIRSGMLSFSGDSRISRWDG